MTRWVCCIALALGALAPSVRADELPADSADRKKREAAKRYVDAGLAAQDQGDHETAVELYEKAYALVPHPTLLFNLGQAHRLAKHAALAIEHYRRFLAETTDPRLGDEARAWIAQLEPEVAREREASKAAADRATTDWLAAGGAAVSRPDAGVTAEGAPAKGAPAGGAAVAGQGPAAPAPRAIAPRIVEREVAAPPAEPLGDERATGRRGLRLAGAGVAIAGALAASGGALFGMRARRLSDELSRPGAAYDPARIRGGERAERTMYVLYAAGGAAIATGAVLFVVGRRGAGSSRTARVVPAWSGDAVGLALSGGF